MAAILLRQMRARQSQGFTQLRPNGWIKACFGFSKPSNRCRCTVGIKESMHNVFKLYLIVTQHGLH